MRSEIVKLNVGGLKLQVTLDYVDGRIFINSRYNKNLVEEIKTTFSGYKWHGYDEENPRKLWSILDNEHNAFQLEYLKGGNPYLRYDKPIEITKVPTRPEVRQHQINLFNFTMMRRHCILAADMGVGKTLTVIEVMEQSGYHDWWYIAPKNALVSVELELIKWNCKVQPRLFTYEQATKELKTWRGAAPRGLIADEAARVKTATSQRTQAINYVAASIRKEHGYESFVILMTGTPAPKSPIDWWSLCNIARPGYLKEGSPDQLKARLAIIQKTESATGGFFPKIIAWRDNESRCAKCGQAEAEHGDPLWGGSACIYEKSINEVAKLNRRMKGLVEVLFKKDCLDLPEKIYRVVTIAPEKATLRTASLIARSSKRAIDTLIKLRELSDGFQYKEIELTNETCSNCHGQKQIDGEACNFCSGIGMTKTFHREALRVACPKDDALNEELETLDDVGRVVIYAGFTESIDRVVEVCQKAGWKTIRVDGRGCDSELGTSVIDCVRVFQSDTEEKIAFIGHPGSAGEGLTLTKSPMIIYYSNDFNGGYRIQSEDRIHRMGMDVNRGATIVDFIHLPSDQLVLSNLQRKRELQSITMGELAEALLLDRVE